MFTREEELEALLDEKNIELEQVWEAVRAAYTLLLPAANGARPTQKLCIDAAGVDDLVWSIELLAQDAERDL